MNGELVFLKICGIALDDNASRQLIIAGLKRLAAARPDDLFYAICGGGAPVDSLRALYEAEPDQICQDWFQQAGEVVSPAEAAHWLAIHVMDERAKELHDECREVGNLIFPPVSRLLREREGKLPRTWEITSDSITYWLAVSLACDPAFPRIILLKDVDGAFKVKTAPGGLPRRSRDVQGNLVHQILVHNRHARPALSSYPFDEYLFGLVDDFQQPFHVINWRHLDRILDLLENGATMLGTKIIPV